jgi:hypothetical protein
MDAVALRNCHIGYLSSTASASSNDTTSQNHFQTISVQMPAQTGAVGVYLSASGGTFGGSDTCCETWNSVDIIGSSGIGQYCIIANVVDSDVFNGISCLIDSSLGICLLYSFPSGITYLPANNSFNYYNCASLTGTGINAAHTQVVSGVAGGASNLHNWVDRPSLINSSIWTTIPGVSIVNSP